MWVIFCGWGQLGAHWPSPISLNLTPQIDIEYQRGLSEAQNGYDFGMIPGFGPPDGHLSSLVLDGSSACKLFTARCPLQITHCTKLHDF